MCDIHQSHSCISIKWITTGTMGMGRARLMHGCPPVHVCNRTREVRASALLRQIQECGDEIDLYYVSNCIAGHTISSTSVISMIEKDPRRLCLLKRNSSTLYGHVTSTVATIAVCREHKSLNFTCTVSTRYLTFFTCHLYFQR